MIPVALVAAALLSADSPGPVAEPAPLSTDAPAPARGRPLSLAAGVSLLRYDDIPVTLGTLRATAVSLPEPRGGANGRFGLGFAVEATGGRTEAGLRTGGLVAGPQLVLASERFRAGVGLEIGVYGVRRATDEITGLLLCGFFRGLLEADLWRFERQTLFASLTGTFGGGSDIPFRGGALLLGFRL